MAKKEVAEKKTYVDIKYNLTKYFSFLKKYRFLFIVCLIVVLAIESSRIINNFLFKKLIDDGTSFSSGLITKSALVNSFSLVAIIFVIAFVLAAILSGVRIFLINKIEANLIQDLKVHFFNHIISLSHDFFTTHKSGSLISKLARGGRATEKMTDILVFNFSPLFFQILVVGISLAYFDFLSSVIVFCTVVLYVLYSYFLQTFQRKHQKTANDCDDFEKAKIADYMTNIDSIKYFGKENFVKKSYFDITGRTKQAFIKFWNFFGYLNMGQSFILGSGIFFIVLFPALKFLSGDITIGSLVFIYTSFVTLIDPLESFTYGMREFYNTMGDFESLFAYGKIENDIKDAPNAKDLKIAKGSLKFNAVNFSYGKRKIFENFSLDIKKGEKVAVVGHSGSGKSTLIKLLYRLYDVNSGSIQIDGMDIKNVTQESLRQEMSIVPQECVLFDDTIYNNIAFSNPDAKRGDVFSAIKFAQLDNIIMQFPNKENTVVGERGVKLSGGEKQRVSIARAILADKKILVLDEATSSLDSETEHEIQKDFKKLMQGRTSIIIAHRLSTIMNADKIVVMKKGKVIQIGRHADLIRTKGEYQKLWKLQKGGYIH